MNNFIFKSPRRLVKNSSINIGATLLLKLEYIQKELRHQRQDNKDIMLMINKLLIDRHLQMQVDQYFEEDKIDAPHPEDSADIDWWFSELLLRRSSDKELDTLLNIINLREERLIAFILDSPNLKRLVAELDMDLPRDQ